MPKPRDVGLVPKQFILDSGINVFGLELALESYLKTPLAEAAEGIRFKVNIKGTVVEVTFRPSPSGE